MVIRLRGMITGADQEITATGRGMGVLDFPIVMEITGTVRGMGVLDFHMVTSLPR